MHGWMFHKKRSRAPGLAASALTLFMIVAGTGSADAANPAWQVQNSPDATLSGGQLESVSCSSADACTAVGMNLDTSGISVTLAERWNGRTWQRQTTPNPRADTSFAVQPDLLGVSCPASNFCQAVGTYQLGNVGIGFAEAWNGRRWRSQSFPFPADAHSIALDQVSCISARFCEAVGSVNGFAGTLTLAATWNGTSWRLQSTPNPVMPAGPASAQLNGVSCVSVKFCEAAGSGGGSSNATFAERWNGKSWLLQSVPGTGGVNSVSCVAETFCEVVGPGSADVWKGSSWKAQTIPGPAGNFSGVSCATAKFCELVGEFSNGNLVGLAAKWNGSAWTAQSTPNPPAATFTRLNGVSCVSQSSCTTAGFFELEESSPDTKALAEGWNGHAWKLEHAIAPQGATDNSLSSVSCVSASFCEAVGLHDDSLAVGDNEVDLAEMWDGTKWTIQTSPVDAGLQSVSCVTARFCEAVGTGPKGASAELWNGTKWKVQAKPGLDVQPQAVSCATVDFCMAVTGSQVQLWNGSSWSAGPSVPGFSPVEGVSCASAKFCEVVGGGPPGENAAMWNGSSWTVQATPGPPSTGLSSVSCPNANACEAVGQALGQNSKIVTLAEAWNGSTWTIQRTPNPSTSQGASLVAVSCTSSISCAAVGSYQFSFLGFFDTLAEVWNGKTWSLRSTPDNLNAGSNTLSGVSCGASDKCTAVGGTQDLGEIETTLIEAGD